MSGVVLGFQQRFVLSFSQTLRLEWLTFLSARAAIGLKCCLEDETSGPRSKRWPGLVAHHDGPNKVSARAF